MSETNGKSSKQTSSIWSLEGIGSALGGAFFEDPASSDDDVPKTAHVSKASVCPLQEPNIMNKSSPTNSSTITSSSSSSNINSISGSSSRSSSSSSSSGSGSGDNNTNSDGDNSHSPNGLGGKDGTKDAKNGIWGVMSGMSGVASMGMGAVGHVVPTFGMLSPKKDFPQPQKNSHPRKKGEVPVAGVTCSDFKRSGLTNEFHTWYSCDASTFELRVGPNYEKNKKKGPSADSLYEIVGIDIYKTASKIDNIGSKVQLPSEWKVKTNQPDVPPIFIVQCQLPEVSLISMPTFAEITDGPGWSVTLYFRIKQSTADALKDLASASGGLKLFADFCSNAPEQESNPKSPYRGRFKVCPRIDNIEELSLPYIVSSYNCKPALIVKTGSIYRGDGYIEVDVNVHNFGAAARTALQILRFDAMTANWGFCIESKDDSEMPEVLFGCMCLNRQMLSLADEWSS